MTDEKTILAGSLVEAIGGNPQTETSESSIGEQVPSKETVEVPNPSQEETPETPFSRENPLIIDKMIANEQGGLNYTLALNKEQVYVLLNFAIMFLISQGLVIFADQAPDAPAKEDETKITLGEQLH